MLISIIVPFYNVEPYFRRCLDSIVNQTYRNLEIILVNDCSPDNSIAIAREYAAKDDRIVIIEHEKNSGQGIARNSALAVAKGEYIWFLDSDDAITHADVVRQLHQESKNVDILFFNTFSITPDLHEHLSSHTRRKQAMAFNNNPQAFLEALGQWLLNGATEDNQISGWATDKWYKRQLLIDNAFSFGGARLNEDGISILLLAKADSVRFSSVIGYTYHMRLGSATHIIQNTQESNGFWDNGHTIKHMENSLYVTEYLFKSKIYQGLDADFRQKISYTFVSQYLNNLWKVTESKSTTQKNSLYLVGYDHLCTILSLCQPLIVLEEQPKRLQMSMNKLVSFSQNMNQDFSNKQKLAALKQAGIYKKKNTFSLKKLVKKAIKMLLPYGFIRYVQIYKKKRKS